MRRSLERRHFPVSGVAPGEVLVTPAFAHPARGTVYCPAAPVAASALLASDLRVGHGPVSACATGDAILHAVSYLDPDGHATGLGVAVRGDDRRAMSRAEEVVRIWSDVMRTRRVLIEATGPSCAGLRREAAMIAQTAGPVHLLTPAAGRPDGPLSRLSRDTRRVQRLADVPDGATVILPAHGVDRRTRAEVAAGSRARGLRIVDATCPLVTRTHATTGRFADEGATVVLIGDAGHAAVAPIVGQAPDAVVVVTTPEQVDDLSVDTPDQVAFVLSPGLAVEDATVIAARLRARFGRPLGQHPNEYCYAASDRRAAVRAVASSSELTLVLGDPAAGDTAELAAAAAAAGSRVEPVDDIGRLRPEWLEPVAAIGILTGTTARPDLAGELIVVLSGLGPLSLTHRQVTTEVQRAAWVRPGTRRAS